jgi:hypothetical protein
MNVWYNFKLKDNIWQNVPLESILVLNDANETLLNQLLFQKIGLLKNEKMDCGDPTRYLQKVKTRFYSSPEGLQFFMPRYDNYDAFNDCIPILLTWAELKPFLN